MAEDETDESQKTEEPTAKKLEEARKKGQVPLSREVNNWMMLFAATILLVGLAGPMMESLAVMLRSFLEHAHDLPTSSGGLSKVTGTALKQVLMIVALPLAVLMLAAFLSPFVQIGPLLSAETIKPDISKLSLMKGFKRLFSARSLVEFGKGILKLMAIGLVGVIIIYPYFGQMEHMVGMPMPLLMEEIKALMTWLMIGVLIVLLVVAVIDLVYQRHEHHKKMKMSRQEIKEEFKQSEGDPHVKAKLRQLRSEKSRQRMIQSVPEADVVITNPTHYSIALKYDRATMDAPICVAKGIDAVALRIREVATENGIELFENKPLARTLYDVVEVDEAIPVEHYQAVAEVISFVFQRQGKLT